MEDNFINKIKKIINKRIVLVAILFVVAIILFFIALFDCIKLSSYSNYNVIKANNSKGYAISITNETKESIERFRKYNSFLLYKKSKKIELNNKNLLRKVKADVIYSYGDINLLFNNEESDMSIAPNNCILSKALSYKLFGCTSVKNVELEINNKKYIVIDTISYDEDMAFINSINDDVNYNYLISYTDKAQDINLKDTVSNTFGFIGTVLNLKTTSMYANLIVSIPLLLLFVIAIFIIVKDIRIDKKKIVTYYKNNKNDKSLKTMIVNNKKPAIFFVVKIVILILFIIWFLNSYISLLNFSTDILPTKWSDFDFWTKLFSANDKQFDLLLNNQSIKILKDYYTIWNSSIRLSILSLIVILIDIIVWKGSNFNNVKAFIKKYYKRVQQRNKSSR